MLIFKRPEKTLEVFHKVRAARPKKLYIASDGARDKPENEGELVRECRSIVELVDWDCEVSTLFRENNMGSWNAIPDAIDWFFEQEKWGVVLEDDCLPDDSFFSYCATMLERYENDERVWWVNGSNLGYENNAVDDGYYFSSYPLSWGWASWRRVWLKHDQAMIEWKNLNSYKFIFLEKSLKVRVYWSTIFEWASVHSNWDYRLKCSCILNQGITITPSVNLIANVGFGDEAAVHTRDKSDDRGFISTGIARNLDLYTKEPVVDQKIDEYMERKLYKISYSSIVKLFIAARAPNTYKKLRKLVHGY